MTYIVGDRVRVQGTFKRHTDGALMDPNTVIARVKDPGGGETSFTYGTDADLVQDSTGVYYVDVDLTAHGTWTIRWIGDGNLKGAEELRLVVRKSAFASP